jgi:squalene-hopene/tetraprenyl-beta-curcumene cyclase
MRVTWIALALLTLVGMRPVAQADPQNDFRKQGQQAVAKGMAYLRAVQEEDGSWNDYPATTALAVTALLRNGRTELNEPGIAKGIRYILRHVKPNGAIYSDADPATALPNYNTSLCLMALALTRNPAYLPTIKKAQKYIEESQFDEGEGKTKDDPMYGGIGYGSKPDRPDLSNLQMALEAMKESQAPSSSPMWQKAILFLQRVQNRKASNDQEWVKDLSGDGGFIYDSKGRSFSESGGKMQSYGSMTYAGLKSYLYAGLTKDDPRAQAAWNWIRAHYSVSEHPGMGDQSLYYYYHTMAKTFDVYGAKIIVDGKGEKHDWKKELTTAILSAQRPDGSWVNKNGRFWEDRPALVTSYSLIALAYCLKK